MAKNETLAIHISSIYGTNLLCGLPYLVDSYNARMVCFGEGNMEHENLVFFLSVNTHGVMCQFSWTHDALP